MNLTTKQRDRVRCIVLRYFDRVSTVRFYRGDACGKAVGSFQLISYVRVTEKSSVTPNAGRAREHDGW